MTRFSALALLFFVSPLFAQLPPPAPAPVTPPEPTGKFIPIAQDNRVRNVGGNCGWCALQTIATHQGLHEMNGISKGMGACTSETVAKFLRSCNLKDGPDFKFVTDKTKSWELAKDFLDAGRPVLFNTAGHALVCCGYSQTPDGREFVFVIDNTGAAEAKVKAWPRAKFEERHRGWVLGIWRCRPGKCPTTPRSDPLPIPKPRPIGPDLDPTPDITPRPVNPPTPAPEIKPNKPVPPPVINPDGAKLDKLLERLEEIAKMKAIPGPAGKDGADGLPGLNGKDGRDGKDADAAALQKQIDSLRAELVSQRSVIANLSGSFVVEVVPRK